MSLHQSDSIYDKERNLYSQLQYFLHIFSNTPFHPPYKISGQRMWVVSGTDPGCFKHITFATLSLINLKTANFSLRKLKFLPYFLGHARTSGCCRPIDRRVVGWIATSGKYYVIIDKLNDGIIYCVDSDTIGQFTGLLDAHGKEIYEGDILKGTTNKWRLEDKPASHDFVGYVRWEEQCDVGLEWVLTSMDSTGSSPLNHYVHCVAIEYSTGSIIGNIHDNPELLSEK